jgi:16S rRNA (cytidine1402-2'-O)-methyltransferase
MAGTLYVVGAPAGDANDLTRRAARILGEVALVVADDEGHAQRLLAYHNIATPLISAGRVAALDALETGDLALLSPGWSPGPAGAGYQLVCSAIERGLSVVSIPGPSLPLTALVISGLPADSFVYLGELPLRQPARNDLLASLAAERRTLEKGTEVIWRGTLGESPFGTKVPNTDDGESSLTREHWAQSLDPPLGQRAPGPLALVVGGAREQAVRWDEARLQAEIHALRQQGLGTNKIGRQLAAESGWPRRDIYRLAVKTTQPDTDTGWNSHAQPER